MLGATFFGEDAFYKKEDCEKKFETTFLSDKGPKSCYELSIGDKKKYIENQFSILSEWSSLVLSGYHTLAGKCVFLPISTPRLLGWGNGAIQRQRKK